MGIVPVGALGVAFHHHLAGAGPLPDPGVVFLSRRAGPAAERWREDMSVRIETPSGPADLPLAGRLAGTLPEAAAKGLLPGIILVCTNPDQLFDVVADYVAVIEHENRANGLASPSRLPLLVLCANGIYFQRVRSSFIELLEESTVLGRLPDLWPELMPAVVGRLMRGVTIQTALRRGTGTSAVYRPGPPGRTLLAGGDRAARSAAARLLSQRGGWFEDAGDVPPTRAEFNKALVNLTMNVFGQLAAIDEKGRFTPLTVAEIRRRVEPSRILGLVEAVTLVGRGVGVFGAHESAADVSAELYRSLSPAGAHVPSSLQLVQQQLQSGTLGPALAPTEKWLIEPLKHYARSLSDPRALHYFEGLEGELTAALSRAASVGLDKGLSRPEPA